mgnify:FL=1
MAFVAKLRNGIFRNTGACLSPVNAYLNLIGIETLGLRMERECQNALELAHWIAENYSDIIVNYPGLESSSWHHVTKEQFEHGYGAILTLRVGSKEKAFKFIDSLTIPYIISNIGDTKALKNQRLIRTRYRRRMKMAEKVDYAALKKGGFMRQKQKGCFSLRLAVVGGNLTAENIKTVAEVAEKYGHGYVHMTSRQGIEIPFIKVEDINEVKEELAKGGVGTGVCGPRVRTITACQGAAICPSGCIDTYTLAKELDARYFGRELPHKFKFGVTGCQNNCLKAEENDVGIKGGMTVECNHDDCIQCGVCVKACREGALRMEDGKIVIDREKCNNCARCVKSCPTDAWVGEPGYIVSFGGLFGNKIYKGEQIVPIIRDKETLFRVTDAAISFFEKHANAGERFRLTLERVGKEEFKKEVQAAYEGR